MRLKYVAYTLNGACNQQISSKENRNQKTEHTQNQTETAEISWSYKEKIEPREFVTFKVYRKHKG